MRFYGQFNPPVDKFIMERYFPNKKNGTAIECGAFDGIAECSCKIFEEYFDWKVFNIEASPPVFEKLLVNRPNSVNLNKAISNKNGSATFTHALPKDKGLFGNGSLSHQASHRNQLIHMGCDMVEYEVETITYDSLVSELGITNLDLFVLDVEGHELSVIEGMSAKSVLPVVFCIEHGNIGAETIKKAMAHLPYQFDTTSHVNSYYYRI